MWRIWCYALGKKEGRNKKDADKIALLRTFILLTYFVTNCFIVAGVIRHWNTEGKTLIYMCQEERNMRRSCTLVSEN